MKTLKLKDPTSPRHLVRLHVKQKLELVITDINVVVNTTGFLESKYVVNDKNERVFTIYPFESMLKYAPLSTHYLGEITAGNTLIMVYLEPSVKSNVITVINPFNDSIRIRPYNLVEFIYSNANAQKDIHWTWELKQDIDLVEIEYKISEYDKPSIFPTYRDLYENSIIQHHFLFKLDRGLLTAMQQIPEKDVYIGRLAVVSDEYDDDSFVDIYCDLLPKWRTKTVDFMIGRQVVDRTHSSTNRCFLKSMKIDFELIDTKSIFAGCNTIEV